MKKVIKDTLYKIIPSQQREEETIASYFDGKTILITGASMGIGEGLALQLATYKTNLILCARSEDLLVKVAQKCRENGAKGVITVKCDVTQQNDCKRAVDEGIKQFKGLDVLVCNAGISGSIKFEEMKDLKIFNTMMQVNFMGYVNFTHFALPHLKKSNDARILVVSSMSGKIGVPFRTAYCASKYAVNGFFDVLRNELAVTSPNIKISLLCPGWVDTGIRQRHVVESQKKYDKNMMMSVDTMVHKSLLAGANGKREERYDFIQKAIPFVNSIYPSAIDSFLLKKTNARAKL